MMQPLGKTRTEELKELVLKLIDHVERQEREIESLKLELELYKKLSEVPRYTPSPPIYVPYPVPKRIDPYYWLEPVITCDSQTSGTINENYTYL